MAGPKRPFKFSKGPLIPLEVWVIFAIAFLFRLAFFFHHQDQGYNLENDPSLYLALADGLKHGVFSMFHPLDIPETTRMPGYPALLYLFSSITGVLLLQVLLSALKIPLAYMLGRSLGLKKDRMVLLPLLLLAIEPMDIILSGSLLTESLFTTMLLAGLVFLVRLKGWPDVVIAGGLFAAAAYLRPNGLLLALLAGVFLAFRGGIDRWKAAAFLACVMVLLLPWALRNQAVDGRFHLSDSGAVVAAHFHVPEVLSLAGDPRAANYREELGRLAANTNWSDRVEMRVYFTTIGGQASSTFAEHPIAWIAVQLRKAGRILVAPGSGHINSYFAGMPVIGFGVMLYSSLYSLLLLVICIGLLLQWRRMGWAHLLLAGLVLLILLSSAISTADSRFKNPAMPLLLLLGAWVWEGWQWRAGRRLEKRSAGAISS